MSTKAVRATTVAALTAFALSGVVFTASAASAEPNNSGGGHKGCAVYHVETGTSEEKPDGTLIIAASGSVKQCKDGDWVTVPGRVGVSGKVGALAVTPSLATFR